MYVWLQQKRKEDTDANGRGLDGAMENIRTLVRWGRGILDRDGDWDWEGGV